MVNKSGSGLFTKSFDKFGTISWLLLTTGCDNVFGLINAGNHIFDWMNKNYGNKF